MKNAFNRISFYLKSNIGIFIAVFLIFCAGLAFGGYTAATLPSEETATVKNYTDKFFSALILNTTDKGSVFIKQFLYNLKLIAFIWISGFFVFLIPVSLLQIFFKGFRTGFSIAFFAGTYKIKGTLYALCNYLSGNLILLPIIIFFTVFSMKNAAKNASGIKINRFRQKTFITPKNIAMFAVCVLTIIITGLFDSYLMSSVLKMIVSV